MKRFAILLLFSLTACVPRYTTQDEPVQSRTYLPLIMHGDEIPVYVENEGANWSILDPYYPDLEIMKVSVNYEWLLEQGWGYFDRKITGFDGDLFLVLKGSHPAWVMPSCKPVPRQYWDEWVNAFVLSSIQYIGVERISYLGIMNEPDTAYDAAWRYFGCWGETFQDGQYYGEFVNHVYGRIKVLYPNLTILAGGFMNYDNPFVLGFRENIRYLDGISFHSYPYCGRTSDTQERVNWYAATFSEYELYLSETSLIYNEDSLECQQEQVAYMRWLQDELSGIKLSVWYTSGCNSWKNADMIYPCNPLTPKPVYWEWKQ